MSATVSAYEMDDATTVLRTNQGVDCFQKGRIACRFGFKLREDAGQSRITTKNQFYIYTHWSQVRVKMWVRSRIIGNLSCTFEAGFAVVRNETIFAQERSKQQ